MVCESREVDSVLFGRDGFCFGPGFNVVDGHVVGAVGGDEVVACVVEVEGGDVWLGGGIVGWCAVFGFGGGGGWEVFCWAVGFDYVGDFLLGGDGHVGGGEVVGGEGVW